VLLLLCDRDQVWVEEMSEGSVSSDENELPKRVAGARLLQQPEQSFHCDIHHLVGSFLAGRAMNDVCDPLHCGAHGLAVGDVSFYDFNSLMRIGNSVVAKGPNDNPFMGGGVQDAVNKMSANLACRAGYQDVFHDASVTSVALSLFILISSYSISESPS